MAWNPKSQPYIGVTGTSGLGVSSAPGFPGIGIAVDLDNNKIWFTSEDARWLGDTLANQNPATNTGGIDISGVAGTKYPGGSVYNATATANFGATPFYLNVPAGFSAWGSSATWNPSDKSANITLSNGNLTEAWGTASWQTARGTAGYTTGKYYYEFYFSTGTYAMAGVCNSSLVLTTHTGAANGVGLLSNSQVYLLNSIYGTVTLGTYGATLIAGGAAWRTMVGGTSYSTGKYYFEQTINAIAASDYIFNGVCDGSHLVMNQPGVNTHGMVWLSGTGQVYYNNTAIATYEVPAAGDTLGIAVDLGASKIWFYRTKWNNDVIGNQNPATGTGGLSLYSVGTPLFPAVCCYGWTGGTTATTNFGRSAFAHTIPSGFIPWEVPIAGLTGNNVPILGTGVY